MKTLRVLLLVVLAIMLPVRSVMAAAMLCPPPAMAGEAQAAHTGPAHPGVAGEHRHAAAEAGAYAGHARAMAGPGAAHGDAPGVAGHDPAADHDHPASGHGSAAFSHHHDGAVGTESCNLCSACCSMPPLAGSAPTVALPRDLGPASFPALSVPAPDFLSDGQERPPRSI